MLMVIYEGTNLRVEKGSYAEVSEPGRDVTRKADAEGAFMLSALCTNCLDRTNSAVEFGS